MPPPTLDDSLGIFAASFAGVSLHATGTAPTHPHTHGHSATGAHPHYAGVTGAAGEHEPITGVEDSAAEPTFGVDATAGTYAMPTVTPTVIASAPTAAESMSAMDATAGSYAAHASSSAPMPAPPMDMEPGTIYRHDPETGFFVPVPCSGASVHAPMPSSSGRRLPTPPSSRGSTRLSTSARSVRSELRTLM